MAPKHIDPKFLDPKHVFKDLAASLAPGESGISIGTAESNVFHPDKKRRHRDGYADGDYTLFKSLPASSFILGDDSISFLGSVNKITFLTEEEKEQDASYCSDILFSYRSFLHRWLDLDITTGDVKANCDDLKVLGKGDFKALLKWRLALREEVRTLPNAPVQLFMHFRFSSALISRLKLQRMQWNKSRS